MNLRDITLRYMGWCPGVKSAARFIPDNDVPPTRIALFVAIVALTSVSSYLATQRALAIVGWPQAPNAEVSNNNLDLASSGDEIYVSVTVETRARWDPLGIVHSGVYTAKLSLDGSLEDETKVLSIEAHMGPMDLLITEDGRWLMAYQYFQWGSESLRYSDLFFIHSDDGREWSEPEVIAESKWGDDALFPKLLEMENGDIFLLTGRHYRVHSSETGWGPARDVPLWVEDMQTLAHEVYPFLDEEGRVAIVGVHRDLKTRKAFDEQGLPLTVLNEDGSWTDPRYLTHLGIPLRGQNPYILYSEVAGGYLLLMEDVGKDISDSWSVQFSPNLETWGRPVPFLEDKPLDGIVVDIFDPSLAELQDGTFVITYRGITRDVTDYPEAIYRISKRLYASTSVDGVTWTAPVEIEKILDEEAFVVVSSGHRVIVSSLSSLALTAAVIVVMVKEFGSLFTGDVMFKEWT